MHQTEPLAGLALYILDRSAGDILKKYRKTIWGPSLGKPDPGYPDADKILGKYINDILDSAMADSRKYLSALLYVAALTSENTPLIHTSYLIAMDALNSRAIRLLETDRQGRAKTDDLRPGNYFVCGVFRIWKITRVWNVPVDLKPGENRLTLDNNNTVGK